MNILHTLSLHLTNKFLWGYVNAVKLSTILKPQSVSLNRARLVALAVGVTNLNIPYAMARMLFSKKFPVFPPQLASYLDA
jgi:hypothetical protein